ncbi:MAG TPA: TIGR02996 domain-containing protein [Gemmata sp.]
MNDEAALLAAILANPGEDTPRLVFADWLDENGHPERAEFIRVQTELARRPSTERKTPAYRALLVRFRQLVAAHASLWAEALGVPSTRAIFRRGFIEHVTFAPDEVPGPSNSALVREPLRHVKVEHPLRTGGRPAPGAPVLRRLASWPGHGRFDILELNGLDIPAEAIGPFLEAPAVARLRVLACPLSPGGVVALTESPHLAHLEQLALGAVRLSAEQALALARTRNLPKLRHLDLTVRCDQLADDADPDPMRSAINALTARYGNGVYLSRW